MNQHHLRIVVADDERDVRDYFADVLPDLGHELLGSAKTGQELVELCRLYQPDLVISDVRMPEKDGLDAVRELNAERFTPVIIVTAFHDSTTLGRATDAQVFAYLVKPFERPQLESAIEVAWTRFTQFQNVRDEAQSLRQALEDRKIIERAKGILMKQAGVDEEQAFRRLRKLARDKQKRLSEIAEMIVTAHEAMGDL
ncbi:MAG: response regulator [Pirellulales bacterium]